MENYILKLNSGTEYKLYKGTTLVSDADLTTLFGVAGEMYLSFDFNSGTPSDLTTLTITDSSDIAVITNTNVTVAEGKNYKATWSNSATTFDTFEELEGKALDESQLSFLMEKIKNAGGSEIIEKDFASFSGSDAWDFFGGADAANKIFRVINTGAYKTMYFGTVHGANFSDIAFQNSSNQAIDTKYFFFSKDTNSTYYNFIVLDLRSGEVIKGMYGQSIASPGVRKIASLPINGLTTTNQGYPLDATQGKVLADRIGDLTALTTTAKTSTVAAINEVDSNLNDAAYVGNVLATPSSVVYVATDNIQDGAVTSDKIDFTTLIDKIYPVGSIYMSANNVSPATFIGGTWTAWGAGRVPVGVDTSDTSFNTVEKTGGSKDLQQHAHGLPVGNIAYYVGDSSGQSNFTGGNSCQFWSQNVSTNNAGTGNSGNLQPYITCYMWKRTA